MDVTKSRDDLPAAIQRNSSNAGHVSREFSQVCRYFLQKSGSEMIFLVVTGMEGDWVVQMCVCVFRGKPKCCVCMNECVLCVCVHVCMCVVCVYMYVYE